jgi:hypothetical protein
MGLFNRTGVPLEYNSPEFDAKGDYIITQNDTLHLRYVRTSFSTPYDFFNFPNNLPGFDSEQSGVWQNAGITYTHIFSPTLLERSPCLVRPHGPLVSAEAGQRACRQHGDHLHCGDARVGRESAIPQGRFHDTYQVQDTVSWTSGQTLPQDWF